MLGLATNKKTGSDRIKRLLLCGIVACLLVLGAGLATQNSATTIDTQLLKKPVTQQSNTPVNNTTATIVKAAPKQKEQPVHQQHKTYTSKTHYKKAHAAYRYHIRGGKGVGDCWTNSAALYARLTGSGQKARIIQYASSYSPRHRSVQVYQNGAWTNYNYKANGYSWRYYATSGSSSGSVVKG